jgi:hypothetical protein
MKVSKQIKKSALSRQNYTLQSEGFKVKLIDKNALIQRNCFGTIEVAECARRVLNEKK